MYDQHELDLTWEFAWCPHGQFLDPTSASYLTFFPAVVPGSVVEDLMRSGIIRDPFLDTQFRDTYWVETQDFWYRTRFSGKTFGSSATKHSGFEDLCLRFDGIDTFASIWLNGEPLGETRNMFRRYAFPASSAFGEESNELYVRLLAPVTEARRLAVEWGVDLEGLSAAFGTHERLPARKMQMSYGWDNHPRIVNAGIYRQVTLVSRRGPALEDVWVDTLEVSPDGESATIRVHAAVDGVCTNPSLRIVGNSGESRFEHQESVKESDARTFEFDLVVRNPSLWWPNGFGAQSLYDTEITLFDEGAVVDRMRLPVGVRTIRVLTAPSGASITRYHVGSLNHEVPPLDGGDVGPWSHVPLSEPREVETFSFVFEINGKPIPIVGADWQPCDAVYSRATLDRSAVFLESAHQLGFNMIRIWGGGFVEPDGFYDRCSELGLLVWQDFPFASATYPQCEPFAAEVELEARDIVRRLRRHACLGAWCGDNESDMNNYDRGRDPEANVINHRVLPSVLEELDPRRYYHPSSPWGVEHPRSPWSGDNRNWGAWHPQDNFLHIRLEEARFISEGGAYALPGRETVESGVSEAYRWPVENEVWDLHGGSTDTHYRRFLGMSTRMWKHFADFQTIDEAIEVSQFAQAWGAMALVLHCRRRWPETGGVLWWKLDDCWPCMDGGIIDYTGHRRTCFFSLAYAAAPRVLCFFQNPETDSLELHLINMTDSDCTLTVRFDHGDLDTGVSAQRDRLKATVEPMSCSKLAEYPIGGSSDATVDPESTVFRAIPSAVEEVEVLPAIWTLTPACAWRCYRETTWIQELWQIDEANTGRMADTIKSRDAERRG